MIGIGYAVSREIYLGSFAVFRKMFGSYLSISTEFIWPVLSISTKFTHAASTTCSGYSAILNDHCDFFYLPI